MVSKSWPLVIPLALVCGTALASPLTTSNSAAAKTPICSVGVNLAGISKQLDGAYFFYNTDPPSPFWSGYNETILGSSGVILARFDNDTKPASYWSEKFIAMTKDHLGK